MSSGRGWMDSPPLYRVGYHIWPIILHPWGHSMFCPSCACVGIEGISHPPIFYPLPHDDQRCPVCYRYGDLYRSSNTSF